MAQQDNENDINSANDISVDLADGLEELKATPVDVVRAQLNQEKEALDLNVDPMSLTEQALSDANNNMLMYGSGTWNLDPNDMINGQSVMDPASPLNLRSGETMLNRARDLTRVNPTQTTSYAPNPDIKVPNTADLLTGGPVTSTVKTGSQTDLAQTPELTAYEQDRAAQQAAIKQYTDAQTQATKLQTQLNEAARPLDEARLKVAEEYRNRVEADRTRAMRDYTAAREEVTRIREEMASQNWGSYWESKSTGDRILLGLAVGLGAYGQAKIGGENVALKLLEGFIKDHDNARKAKLDSYTSQLTAASTDSINALQGAQRLNLLAQTAEAADYDVIAKKMDQLAGNLKTPMAQAAASQASAKFTLEANQKMAAQDAQLAAKSTVTKDLFATTTNKYDPTSYTTRDPSTGQMRRMTAQESDANTAGLTQLSPEKLMTDLEGIHIHARPNYRNAYNAIANATEGALAGAVDTVSMLTRLGSKLDEATAGDPDAALYARAAYEIVQAETRKQSGAAMPPNEIAKNYMLMMAKPLELYNNDADAQVRDLGFVRQTRRKWINLNLKAAGNEGVPYFNKEAH